MRRTSKFRYRLFAPLVYLAALLLLLEEWFWDIGERFMAFLATWPWLHHVEERIRRLSPVQALILFCLPAVALFPVKVIALYAITQGFALMGVLVILVAKVVGAAAVARLYMLTKPALLSMPWFARWHDKFIILKDRWIARLRATRAMRSILRLRTRLRSLIEKQLKRDSRGRPRVVRVLRRFVTAWRNRRRSTDHE